MRYLVILLFVALTLASGANSQSNPDCFIDLCFVIDDSGSIQDTDVPGQSDSTYWSLANALLKGVARVVDVGPNQTHVAAVNFDNDATLDFNLNQWTTTSEVLDAIDRIPYYGGNTNMTGGLREARLNVFTSANGDRPGVPNVLMLISDGFATREVDTLMDEVDAIQQLNIRIVAVGVGKSINETLLESLVTSPIDENFFSLTNESSLNETVARLLSSICSVNSESTSTTSTTTSATTPTTTSTTTSTTTPTATTSTTTPTTTSATTSTSTPTTTSAKKSSSTPTTTSTTTSTTTPTTMSTTIDVTTSGTTTSLHSATIVEHLVHYLPLYVLFIYELFFSTHCL